MPSARRAARTTAVALLALTGCTGVEGTPTPALRTFTQAVGSVDLDPIAPDGVDVLDLAAGPAGTLALLADSADPRVGYLAEVTGDGPGDVRRLDDAGGQLAVTDRTPADLAVSPDGRIAYLPVAGFEVTSGVVTLDLRTGEQLADARLCEGQATFGRVALAGDRLTVIGSCITSKAPSTTAFVVG